MSSQLVRSAQLQRQSSDITALRWESLTRARTSREPPPSLRGRSSATVLAGCVGAVTEAAHHEQDSMLPAATKLPEPFSHSAAAQASSAQNFSDVPKVVRSSLSTAGGPEQTRLSPRREAVLASSRKLSLTAYSGRLISQQNGGRAATYV